MPLPDLHCADVCLQVNFSSETGSDMKPFSMFCIAQLFLPFSSSVSPFYLAESWHHACLLLAGRMDLLLPPTLPFNICDTKLNKHPCTGCNSCNIGALPFLQYQVQCQKLRWHDFSVSNQYVYVCSLFSFSQCLCPGKEQKKCNF